MKREKSVSSLNGNIPELKKGGCDSFSVLWRFCTVIHHHHTCSITLYSRIIGIYLKWEWGKKMTSIYHSSSSSICWLGIWIQKFQLIIHSPLKAILSCPELYRICEKRCTIIITRMIRALAIFKVLLR